MGLKDIGAEVDCRQIRQDRWDIGGRRRRRDDSVDGRELEKLHMWHGPHQGTVRVQDAGLEAEWLANVQALETRQRQRRGCLGVAALFHWDVVQLWDLSNQLLEARHGGQQIQNTRRPLSPCGGRAVTG